MPKTARLGRPKDNALTARRESEILTEATRLFARNGYRRTDVQLVADALGVGKGTIYRYFPSKRELFLSAVDQGMRNLQHSVDTAVEQESDPLAQVEAAVRAYLAYFDANQELVELLMQERAEFRDRPKPTYFAHREVRLVRWKKLFAQLIADGRVRPVAVDRVLDVMSDLMYGIIFTNYFAGRRKSFEQQADDVLDVMFQGLLSEEERAHRRSETDTVRP